MTDAEPTNWQPADWQERANVAARSVTGLFGRRLLFLPGTHLAAVQWPSKHLKNLLHPWHYWWQAHYVDCLVDAGRRELGNGATPAARFNGPHHPSAGKLASRLVTGIRLRNAFTFVNNYFDDMAWLALATRRLQGLAEETRKPGRRRNARVHKTLTLQFDSASTDDLGGGTFWSKKRDFKNTPATAPVALYYARTGQQAKAQRLVDWLNAVLFDETQGLYVDGARLNAAGEVMVENTIYTYNQGPVLGALLELGGDANLARAAAVIDGVTQHLTVHTTAPGSFPRILRCDGTGDGGLFTGILCRYLALAAVDARLPESARNTARELVTATAEALWAGRRPAEAGAATAGNGRYVFSTHAANPADTTYPPGAAVELSTQLQAWMVLEAAAAIQPKR
ncbi:glycoside hydrolase family 76 protein [Pseudarthrobacter sp. AL07]|uniref:glycoside hydrolase family 76 protein n=1 Tax=unclassified Pseudarthrobacter TaxID=2647000 RepID=UPI002499FF84|nr:MULTISPECIES: glycoside hydrolase family 76 protein [unclassified Pseudarthrobacter]MDI3194180.1 glycoside hydrolase family 76 protein [Pseudarthrobacter sp. AL20]MDI3208246.1 glycoside hydrolase family 76 protein [Pseudarthrobacter sp. AL07]